VAALEAGAYGFWLLERLGPERPLCIVVPRPSLRLETARGGERLHSFTEPAVAWANGATYWYWHGIRVPRDVGERPEALSARRIVRERNVERRRLMLEHVGYEHFLHTSGAKLLAQDDFGKLWRTDLELEGELAVVVEVVNSTSEPDGSNRRYFLRVPPTTRTARAAVAWTFGFDSAADYLVATET
jgi:hypothetical protein